VGPDWHTSDTLSWLCGPKHQRPLSEGSKLAEHGCNGQRAHVVACVIRTESKLAGMICVNMSGGRSSLGAMEYGKPTGHVLGFLYGRWHASRGPFSHLQSRYSHVRSPRSAKAGCRWERDSTVVIPDHNMVTQSTRDLSCKPHWSPVRSSRARLQYKKIGLLTSFVWTREVETTTNAGWAIVYDTWATCGVSLRSNGGR